MRFPKKELEDGTKIIDQDKVNELVQYAYKNGVNYFDTMGRQTSGSFKYKY